MKRMMVAVCLVIASMSAVPAAANDPNKIDCMDCGERILSEDNVYPAQKEAICCDFGCVGGFVLKQVDVGFGCLICDRDNEIVKGTVCCSSDHDKGCPVRGTPTDPCPRDPDTGACPSWCWECV